jgi:hypothetical protein
MAQWGMRWLIGRMCCMANWEEGIAHEMMWYTVLNDRELWLNERMWRLIGHM